MEQFKLLFPLLSLFINIITIFTITIIIIIIIIIISIALSFFSQLVFLFR